MTGVRPPSLYRPERLRSPLEDALNREVFAEKAGTLSRLLARLDRAMDALAAHEASGDDDPAARAALVDAAAEALWHVVIQRDLMGLRASERFMHEYGVPKAVRLRMGIRPRRHG